MKSKIIPTMFRRSLYDVECNYSSVSKVQGYKNSVGRERS